MLTDEGSYSTVFNLTYCSRSPHDVQYAVPALFKAPQDWQDETERARLESAGLAHMSEEFDDLDFTGLADFFSTLRFAELSRLRLIQVDNLAIGPGPFGVETA